MRRTREKDAREFWRSSIGVGFGQFKQKAAGEIERNGGKVLRVELDYELKVKLYRKLGKAQAPGEGWNQPSKLALADQFRLPVVMARSPSRTCGSSMQTKGPSNEQLGSNPLGWKTERFPYKCPPL